MNDVATQPQADPIDALRRGAHRHEFVQLVRLLERALVLNGNGARGLVGTDALPAHEPLRFAAAASLGFAASQVHALRAPTSGSSLPLEVVVNFLGLIGPAGALPRHYTATAIARGREKDDSLQRFLDLFHSRLIGLFYRAFARYDPSAAFEARRRRADLFTLALRAVVGFPDTGPLARLLDPAAAEHDALGFAGLYGHGRRGARGLEQMLAAQLRLPVKVEQFTGQWLDVPVDQRTRLPVANRAGTHGGAVGVHHRLGANAVLGNRVWDASSRIGVRIGPLDFDQYVSFITAGAGLRRAGVLARLYVRQEFDLLVRPVLLKRAVPQWKLESRAARPQLLGRTIWLRSKQRPFTRDFDAAAYAPPE